MEVVHVINLEIREDRLLHAAKQAKAQGYAIRVWDAIYSPNRVGTKKAICQSHKKIIRYAQENNLPYVIIMEDDCKLFAEGAFQYYMDNMPKDFDLYCGTIFQGDVKEGRVVNGMSATMTLYCVHKRFYNFMLNEVPDDCHIDRYAGDHAHRFKYFIPPLLVCTQTGGFSNNLKKEVYYDAYLENKLIFGKD